VAGECNARSTVWRNGEPLRRPRESGAWWTLYSQSGCGTSEPVRDPFSLKNPVDIVVMTRLSANADAQVLINRGPVSRPLYYSDGSDGRTGNWVDGTALRQTGADLQDANRHLAKVRVAGSNPVFRSIQSSRSEAGF